jgi:hypothetical protein
MQIIGPGIWPKKPEKHGKWETQTIGPGILWETLKK